MYGNKQRQTWLSTERELIASTTKYPSATCFIFIDQDRQKDFILRLLFVVSFTFVSAKDATNSAQRAAATAVADWQMPCPPA